MPAQHLDAPAVDLVSRLQELWRLDPVDGRHEPVAFVDDEALVERAIRRAV